MFQVTPLQPLHYGWPCKSFAYHLVEVFIVRLVETAQLPYDQWVDGRMASSLALVQTLDLKRC